MKGTTLCTIFVLWIGYTLDSCGQQLFYQEIIKGGVLSSGYSSGSIAGEFSGEISIPSMPDNSEIVKAILLVGRHGNAPDLHVTFNDDSYFLSSQNQVSSNFQSVYGGTSGVHMLNVTNSVSPFQNVYEVSTTQVQSAPSNKYCEMILFIMFENTEMGWQTTSILLNDQDFTPIIFYQVATINPINTTEDVGLSLLAGYFCDTLSDGGLVFVEGEFVGLIGGNDYGSEYCGGPVGSFQYYDGNLVGLNDDIANNSFQGSDALANIQNIIQEGSNSIEMSIISQTSNNNTNAVWGLSLAYTTPCLPFETTLTEEVTICRGDTAQLLADGGINYEWLPQEDLSCYNCPNPVFEGDSSKIYTIRIWNTDSCSKVLPVKVNVLDVPHTANLSTNPTTCGEAEGNLIIGGVSGGQSPYLYTLGGNWTTNPTATLFNNLSGGEYTLTVRDQNHCYYSQDFTIEEINPAHASFTANPQSGTEPLEVQFYNQSNATTHYEWMLLDSTFNTFEFDFTFDSAGSYPVQLIAWNHEPHCADTAMATIIVHPAPPDYSHSIFMPTLYNLEIGDFFIETTNVQRVEFEIYNAIGQHIFSTTLDAADGRNDLWDGSRHARGYYFFRIKYWDMQGLEFSERGKVLVVR